MIEPMRRASRKGRLADGRQGHVTIVGGRGQMSLDISVSAKVEIGSANLEIGSDVETNRRRPF